jgi:hypothetical protein
MRPFLKPHVLRQCEKFALVLLGPAARGTRGSLKLRYREEESADPLPSEDDDPEAGGYAFYASDWLKPQKGQMFGRLVGSYRVELLAWAPEDGPWWRALIGVSAKSSGLFELTGGDRSWRCPIWYRPGDGKVTTDAQRQADLRKEQERHNQIVREQLAAMRRSSKGMRRKK